MEYKTLHTFGRVSCFLCYTDVLVILNNIEVISFIIISVKFVNVNIPSILLCGVELPHTHIKTVTTVTTVTLNFDYSIWIFSLLN